MPQTIGSKTRQKRTVTRPLRRLLPSVTRLVLASSFLTSALEAETTGRLQGRVVDEEGVALPGVQVAASSPAQIGGEQLTVTDEWGGFRYPVLAPGDFTVRFDLDGYVPQELTLVRVRIDGTTELRVAMPRATFDDEIVITESTPMVDPEQTSTGQTFTAEYLKKAAIGMDNRNYVTVATQAAGVNQRGSQPPELSVHGSRVWENAYLVDGVDSTAPIFGAPAFDAIGFEAVQEVAVHTAGFGAEYGFANGGVLNVVTKSGGNQFSGSVDLRYRNESFETAGDHYDPDEEPQSRRVLSAAFGGPILRDRLWLFLSGGDNRETTTPVNTPYSSDIEFQVLGAKLTWQATPGWSLVGRYATESFTADRVGAGQLVSEEATGIATYDPRSLGLHSTGILSPRLVWSLQLDDFGSPPERGPFDGDLTRLHHENLVTGESYGNFGELSTIEQDRLEAQTDVAWFVPNKWGTHQIEAGLRFSKLDSRLNQCNPGTGPCRAGQIGLYFRDGVDDNGAHSPLQMVAQEALGWQNFDGVQRSVFVQDQWSVHPDISLQLGLRWDAVEQDNDIGRRVVDYDMLQPRLGLAWNVGGTGQTVVRASWGRFMNPSLLQLAYYLAERSSPTEIWFSCSAFVAADAATCQAAAGDFGLDYRTDPESWDPAGWLLGRVLGSDPLQVTPDLEPNSTDALVLGVESELFRRTSLELSYIHKEATDLIEDTCIGNLPEPTPDADCSSFILANLPQARREYEAWVLRFESRALDRFHAIASWVASETTGSEVNEYTGAMFDVYPWHFTNVDGYLPGQSRHRVRLNGFVDLPWYIVLGLGARWDSEIRWEPWDLETPPYGVLLTEPQGNRKEEGIYEVDLQLSKSFALGRTRIGLIGTVYNLLSTERPTSFCRLVSGCGSEVELGDPVDWQQPRRYEVGLRLDF
jgi:hypothetical protein